jgi:hypothetical protein
MKLLNKLLDSPLFCVPILILLFLLIAPLIVIAIFKIFIFLGSLYIEYLQFIGIELPDDTRGLY